MWHYILYMTVPKAGPASGTSPNRFAVIIDMAAGFSSGRIPWRSAHGRRAVIFVVF
jgi:hypothetical protein